VPPERREQLFRRFGPSDTPRRGGGSGLGLYIVKLIAQNHGGDAYYEERAGGGSIFFIDLPLLTPDQNAETPTIAAAGST